MMTTQLIQRIKARSEQLGINTLKLAQRADVNRSFLYDVLQGRSKRPSAEKLGKVAEALRVDVDWLLTGHGHVEGLQPGDEVDDLYVAIRSMKTSASMGGGFFVADEVEEGEPYHFRRAWVRETLKTAPRDLRILPVEGDSMEPTLTDGDIVLVDLTHKTPTPPGIFILFDGMGLVAKRIEHVPNSDPPTIRIISDNLRYSAYERTVDEVNMVGRVRWFAREI